MVWPKLIKISVFIWFFSSSVFSQSQSTFKIFYSQANYVDETSSLLSKQDNFAMYKLMLGVHIDPKNTGGVDKDKFIKSLRSFYPDSLSKGILCIDLENKSFHNLFKYDAETAEFKEAKAQFIWMIKKVKELRPNVKVGFYALPGRAYYANAKSCSDKVDAILSLSDYIFPSLYTMYPNKQVGKARNERYLRENLECALEFGRRLNKPVVPFIWNIVHPSNKLYGGQLVDIQELRDNIDYIKNFKFKGNAVAGVVWWDPDFKSFAKMNKTKLKTGKTELKMKEEQPKYIQSQLLEEYLKPYIKR